jgi:hypothetical protein
MKQIQWNQITPGLENDKVLVKLEEQDESALLPTVIRSASVSEHLQRIRNNLKLLSNGVPGGDLEGSPVNTDEIEEALPPFLTDRDGMLIAGRGGVLIELNLEEPAAESSE